MLLYLHEHFVWILVYYNSLMLQKTWCIANPLSNNSVLASNIEYVCSQLDCRMIQPNGPCFEPDTQMHHASFLMNLYYQANGRHLANCDFRNSGLVSLTDPSKCHPSIQFEFLLVPLNG